MKLKDVPLKGTRAITRVPLPLCNTPGSLLEDQPELAAQRAQDGDPDRSEVEVGIRALNPGEFATVIERAHEYATTRGITMLDERNPVYSLGYTLNLLALACVDPDSDPKDPDPFFGTRGNVQSAIDEMLASDHLTRDSLLYLSEHQEAWQDKVSPQATKIGAEKLWALAAEVAASNDARPFLALRPGMQWRLVHFLASQWLSLLSSNSPSGSDSAETS